MMKFLSLSFSLCLVFFIGSTTAQTPFACDKPFLFENNNNVNPEPLFLTRVFGMVQDKDGGWDSRCMCRDFQGR